MDRLDLIRPLARQAGLNPRSVPQPSGPGLRPPAGPGPLADHVVPWVAQRPWLALVALGALVVWVAGSTIVVRARHRPLARHAQQLVLTAPPEVDPVGAAQFWTTVYGTLHRTWWRRLRHGTPHLAYEYRWTGRALSIVIWIPGTVPARALAAAARAAWPAATVTVEPATAAIPTEFTTAAGGALLPVRAEAYPLNAEHDPDPLRQILGAGTGLRPHEHACVQVLARPASPRRVARLRAAPASLRNPSNRSGPTSARFLSGLLDLATPGPSTNRSRTGAASSSHADPTRERDTRASVDKAGAGPHWETAIRYAVSTTSDRGQDSHDLQMRLSGIAGGLAGAHAVYAATNRLRRVRMRHPVAVLAGRQLRRGFLTSTPELAALAGLPTDVAVPGLARARAKAVPPPVQVPTGGRNTLPLGRAEVGGHGIALPVPDARQHLHVLGATGSGKTTELLNLVLAHIKAGRGVVVIDPKGDLVADILDRLPLEAAEKLVLLDPAQKPPPAFNPLEGEDDDLTVDNIVSIFSKIFTHHWGPRMDDILRSALLTLKAYIPHPMLTLVPPLLIDKQNRAEATADLHDPAGLGGFWTWFDSLPEGVRAQANGPVLGRLRSMLGRSFVRQVVGNPISSFNMADVLDGGILLCRVPKGVLGDETARLLGSFIVAAVWQAATARSAQPEAARRDAVLVVDECHNFLNLPRSIDEICAEARGYRLSLVLAHQDLTQLPRETAAAISANCRNKIVFSCSPEDARVLARHTWPELDEHDLSHLDRYTAAARLVIDGAQTAAFTLLTNPPPPPLGHAEEIRARCAELTRATLPPPQPTPPDPGQKPAGGPRRGPRPTRGGGRSERNRAAPRQQG